MADCSFQHECEDFENYKGEADCLNKFQECEKNRGHEKFKPVHDLKMEDVPQEFRTDERMRFIEDRCNRTVKLQVSYTSENRPDTWFGTDHPYPYRDCKGSKRIVRCGTGYIYYKYTHKDKPCPCKECKKSSGNPQNVYLEVEVWTARHVVYDGSEAVQTKVECFYDTPDKTGVTLLFGGESFLCSGWNSVDGPDSDKIVVVCYTHDTDVMDKLDKMIGSDHSCIGDESDSCPGFTVSHPHGVHKLISFGHPQFFIYYTRKNLFPTHTGFVKCRLKHTPSSHDDVIAQCREGIKDEENQIMSTEAITNLSTAAAAAPGVEYLLPDTFKLCVPFYHSYLLDWRFHVDWHDVPKDSGYIDCSGKLVLFPPGMEICCQLKIQFTSVYDIPTCPGSSGAGVFIDKNRNVLYQIHVHSGADKVWGNQGFHGFY